MEKDVKVSEHHIWVSVEEPHVYLGITNYLQQELGTMISIELPDVGDTIEAGEVFAEIESVATVHELIAPISGRVISVNQQIEERPAIVNDDPYSDGWLVEVRVNDTSALGSLMDMDEYYHFVFK
jgi:glycine cleavage system H protein